MQNIVVYRINKEPVILNMEMTEEVTRQKGRLYRTDNGEWKSKKYIVTERIVKIKGLFPDLPDRVSTFELSEKENKLFNAGKIARVKGGLFRVQDASVFSMDKITDIYRKYFGYCSAVKFDHPKMSDFLTDIENYLIIRKK